MRAAIDVTAGAAIGERRRFSVRSGDHVDDGHAQIDAHHVSRGQAEKAQHREDVTRPNTA